MTTNQDAMRPDAAVEIAAIAMFYGQPFLKPPHLLWEGAGADENESYRDLANVALTAAAPIIAAQAKGEAFQAVRDAAEVEPDQVGDYGMVELPGYLTIDTRAFDALDKDDRERLHITADDYAQAIDDARAQAKADALREAADEFGSWGPTGIAAANALRNRADTIEGATP